MNDNNTPIYNSAIGSDNDSTNAFNTINYNKLNNIY